MDRLQAMYKSNKIRPSSAINLKQKAKMERSSKRNDIYSNSRAISPDCVDKSIEKETATKTKSRETLYLERFIAWKHNKAKQLEIKKSTPRIPPFVSAASSSKRIERPIAPINHVFTAPKGLKDPTHQNIGKQSLRSQKVKISPENFIFTQPKPKCMPKKILEPRQKPSKVVNIVKTNNKVMTPLETKQKVIIRKPLKPLDPKQKVDLVKPITKRNIVKTKKPEIINSTFMNSKKKQPQLQINCGLLNEPLLNPLRSSPIAETPNDHTVPNPFSKFITSTKRKSSFKNDLDISKNLTDIISPIEFENAPNENFDSIKKNNECLAENVKLMGKIDNVCIESPINHVYNPKRFKFVRYSNVRTPRQEISKGIGNVADLNTTPVSAIKLRLSNHVSPFVNVTRGKYNQQLEKEKRNSDYVVKDCDTNAVLEYQRTIEIIKYYRMQVKDETARLLAMCDVWDEYKVDNILELQENSVDMIDVVIGQSKLLLNKKFQQFVGLIEKCEKGAVERKTGAKQSEAMPVLSGDLEGFWSMIYIQVDDLENRFKNLNRWKENNWSDPDEIKKKTKKKLTKVEKAKKMPIQKPAKANSALKALMKNYLKTKVTNEDNCGIPHVFQVVTPESYRNRNKLASPLLNDSPKIKKFIESTQNSLKLLKSALVNEPCNVLKPLTPKNSVKGRKSTLNLTGTRGKNLKVFSHEEKNESNRKNFQSNDFSDNEGSKFEENEFRSYTLRGRRVILRDSSEFEIPTINDKNK